MILKSPNSGSWEPSVATPALDRDVYALLVLKVFEDTSRFAEWLLPHNSATQMH
jgi:hypothetical protein